MLSLLPDLTPRDVRSPAAAYVVVVVAVVPHVPRASETNSQPLLLNPI